MSRIWRCLSKILGRQENVPEHNSSALYLEHWHKLDSRRREQFSLCEHRMFTLSDKRLCGWKPKALYLAMPPVFCWELDASNVPFAFWLCVSLLLSKCFNHVGCFGRRKFNGSIIERKVPFLLLKRNAVVFIPSLTEGKALVSHNNGQTPTHQA